MTENLLNVNDGKTHIIYLSSSDHAKSIKTTGLLLGESCITPRGSVKELGFIVDKFLYVNDQVTSVC